MNTYKGIHAILYPVIPGRTNFMSYKINVPMVTCYLDYTIDPTKLQEFEAYAKLWIPLVNKFGGTHHGYFLPHEGANDRAYALFSFPTLSAYETYRLESAQDPACIAAYQYALDTNCIVRYVRSFLRPVFQG